MPTYFIQIHELRTKMSSYSDKVEDLTKVLKSKEEILDAVESKLNKERVELDNTRIYLDEARRDKSKVLFLGSLVVVCHYFKQNYISGPRAIGDVAR
jgi:hypothetical protein